jgi:hypothetical protein
MERYYKAVAFSYNNGNFNEIDVINNRTDFDPLYNVTVSFNKTSFEIPDRKGFIKPPPVKLDSLAQIDKIALDYKN